eukprot:TRINITY_DN1049_c0_g2_i1.p1 TRINITY_DN1049_c0_g2~~TRINITY_DN1049_c0_g2_i1.p1  ORF type:complete len:410 (-),score=50.54 TRINITY_DN1049_c0_g2_i1:6-1235(-)
MFFFMLILVWLFFLLFVICVMAVGMSARSAQGSWFNPRAAYMHLVGFIQGDNVVRLTSQNDTAKRVLKSSNEKGKYLEYCLSCPAWAPILSIESVDGELWSRMSKSFFMLSRSLDWKTRLPDIVDRQLTQCLGDEGRIVSNDVATVVLRILFELVFWRDMDKQEEIMFREAGETLRRGLSQKGPSDKDLLHRFFNHMSEIVQEMNYYDKLGVDVTGISRAEFVSVLIQPFLISPQINFVDIFCDMESLLKGSSELQEKLFQAIETDNSAFVMGVIFESIRTSHPFPILERHLSKDVEKIPAGSQVFIEQDAISNEEKIIDVSRWSGEKEMWKIYGIGPRMCAGMNIANVLLEKIGSFLCSRTHFNRLDLASDHQYSGRRNDGKEGIIEGTYFITQAVRSIYTTIQNKFK